MKAVKFFNSTKEDFSHMWDGEVFSFPAGETMLLKEGLAWHFAKHLAVRELNKLGGKSAFTNRTNVEKMMAKFVILESETEELSEAKLEVEVLNKEAKKPKKAVKKPAKKKKEEPIEVSAEAEFEGLNE